MGAFEGERIAKVIARAGICSRRDAERLIEEGRVQLNGKALASPAVNVGPGDAVTINSVPLPAPERARLWRYHEGLCTQILHIGPYDDEPATVAKMDAFAAEQGYRLDFGTRRHHEIYLGDPRKAAPEKLRTIIRHPIAKI